jgi:hypothetical protein
VESIPNPLFSQALVRTLYEPAAVLFIVCRTELKADHSDGVMASVATKQRQSLK